MDLLRSWLQRRWESRRKSLGRRGEQAAVRFLRRAGLAIVARNVRCGRGEIDIVALDGEELVFVEVKSRTSRSWRVGLEKIDSAKRDALRTACRRYVSQVRGTVEGWRVDLVSVEFDDRRLHPRLLELRWERSVISP